AVVRVPVVLCVRVLAPDPASKVPDLEVRRRQRGFSFRPEDVEVAVLASEDDPTVRDGRRRRDRTAERGLERPGVASREGHDGERSVESAVDRVIAKKNGRRDRGGRGERLGLFLSRRVAAEPE